MANTTFNGPVRSENGFQEWDGSAWVPVSGSAIVIPYNTTTNVELTEVGQQFTLVGDYNISSPPGNAVVTFSCPLATANPVSILVAYLNGIPPTTPVFIQKNDGSITMQPYPFFLQGALAALYDNGSSLQAYVTVSGWSLGTPIS
jgi:hypothetical protein